MKLRKISFLVPAVLLLCLSGCNNPIIDLLDQMDITQFTNEFLANLPQLLLGGLMGSAPA